MRQGTPTNNTAAAPAGFPPDDPDGAQSFAVERGAPLARAGASGDLLARALGMAPSVFDHVEGADRDEQAGARGMAEALWPATWGYFLEQLLLGDDADLASVDAFRRYFVAHVRGRGHHPAFRIGGMPYGVVVASSLARWQHRALRRRSPLERALPEDLRRLRALWNREVPRVPRTGRSDDPDARSGRHPRDGRERARGARAFRDGRDASYNLAALLGADWNGWSSERARLALQVAQPLGRSEIASRIFGLTYGKTALPFGRGSRRVDGSRLAGAAVRDRAARLELHRLDPHGVGRRSAGRASARRRDEADRAALPDAAARVPHATSRTPATGC